MSDVIVYVYMNSELFEPASCREEPDLVRTSRCNIEEHWQIHQPK